VRSADATASVQRWFGLVERPSPSRGNDRCSVGAGSAHGRCRTKIAGPGIRAEVGTLGRISGGHRAARLEVQAAHGEDKGRRPRRPSEPRRAGLDVSRGGSGTTHRVGGSAGARAGERRCSGPPKTRARADPGSRGTRDFRREGRADFYRRGDHASRGPRFGRSQGRGHGGDHRGAGHRRPGDWS